MSQLIKNISWLGLSELTTRVFRLGTTLILPQYLSSEDYGIAAIILTLQDLMSVLEGRKGFNSKLIQVEEDQLETYSKTTYTLSFFISLILFLLQIGLAFLLAYYYHNSKLILPTILLAFTYLLFPLFIIPAALEYRSNNLKTIALLNSLQGMIGNCTSIILAIIGWGYWSLIIPFLFASILWASLLSRRWRPTYNFSLKHYREILRFGMSLLGVEMLNKLRENVDYILVGAFLGIQPLGLYFFSFNAGLGISLSLINTFSNSFYPNLVKAASKGVRAYSAASSKVTIREEYWKSFKLAACIIPIVGLQCILAPYYVPLIFGTKWSDSIPILITICLSAIPRIFKSMTDSLIQLKGNLKELVTFDSFFSLVFVLSVMMAVRFNIQSVALAVCLVHWLILPPYVIYYTKKYL